jgi:hypothetical protein
MFTVEVIFDVMDQFLVSCDEWLHGCETGRRRKENEKEM